MNKQIILLFIAYTLSIALQAQSSHKLNSLKTPNSPAAVILGVQPNSISSPKSWEALETGLYTNFLDSNSNLILPNNFAMEFSPYWATKNKKITMEEFLVPGVGKTLLQNLSLSLATTRSFLINDSVKSNGLGIGLRTMLWQGTKDEKELINSTFADLQKQQRINTKVVMLSERDEIKNIKDYDKYIESLVKLIEVNKDDILKDIDNEKLKNLWIKEFKDYLSSKSDNLDTLKILMNEYVDQYTKIDSTGIKIEKYRADRKGFKLELATSAALNYPTNNVDLAYGSRYGIWITPSFQPFGKNWQWIEFLGVLRYYYYNRDFYNRYSANKEYFTSNFDYGLKLGLKWKKLSFEFEGVGRYSTIILSRVTDAEGNTITTSKSYDDSQYMATLSYQIDDHITLSYNFGKQFQPVINYKGNLVSVINLNFGFGAPTKNDLKP